MISSPAASIVALPTLPSPSFAPTIDAKKKVASPYVKMFAGMAGGLAEAVALQPLDVTKTRLQLDRSGQYKNMWHCGKTIYQTEGGLALYKGLTPFIAHLTLKYALRFGSFAKFKELLGEAPGTKSSNAINFTAGMMTGVLESVLIVTPFDVVKTRLQKEIGKGQFNGPIDLTRQMIAKEGFSALWKGNVATMLRQASNQACNFTTFVWMNENLWKKEEGDGKTLEVWKTLVNGMVAGSVGPSLNTPLDVIKTRMMAQVTVSGEVPKYKNFVQAFQVIAKEEGYGALWKGLMPRLARMAPGQAITWTVVTQITSFFEQ
ncbi:hypothetical protein LEN26_006805 [Aphanomyces euteiches]|nr:hypothetical protein AeMF1_020724 [Aphanomyces euteiches]KAH9134450.1 hypothetical protein LEN26_006805 [Aphanomyces euteiches]KAH9193189.1 hypothetical protein AeNC1_004827 [Aphanomyces euteiches]